MAITGAKRVKAAVPQPLRGTLIEAAVPAVSAAGGEVPATGADDPEAGAGPEGHAPMLLGREAPTGGSKVAADPRAAKPDSRTSTFRKGLPWRRYE